MMFPAKNKSGFGFIKTSLHCSTIVLNFKQQKHDVNTMTNNIETRIKQMIVTECAIDAYLVDGRMISVPLVWSWRLSDATPEQRNNWELIGDGQGVHWPDIDEDLSAKGMLHGIPARRPQRAVV